jgi:hypothetical protein
MWNFTCELRRALGKPCYNQGSWIFRETTSSQMLGLTSAWKSNTDITVLTEQYCCTRRAVEMWFKHVFWEEELYEMV